MSNTASVTFSLRSNAATSCGDNITTGGLNLGIDGCISLTSSNSVCVLASNDSRGVGGGGTNIVSPFYFIAVHISSISMGLSKTNSGSIIWISCGISLCSIILLSK